MYIKIPQVDTNDLVAIWENIDESTRVKVFDWDTAAEYIKRYNVKEAWAGLVEDWTSTGGKILENGFPYLDDFPYLGSLWATPCLIYDNFVVECWVYGDEKDWNEDTLWPDTALQILGEADEIN